MKISRRSWHYKTASMVFKNPSKSLCLYFWQVPISAVVVALVTIAGAVMCLLAAVSILFLLAQPVLFTLTYTPYEVILFLGAVSAVVWGGVLAETHRLFSNRSWNITLFEWGAKKEPKDPKEKKPNLLYAYLKAKKDKVCPTIEFDWS